MISIDIKDIIKWIQHDTNTTKSKLNDNDKFPTDASDLGFKLQLDFIMDGDAPESVFYKKLTFNSYYVRTGSMMHMTIIYKTKNIFEQILV